MVKDNKIRKMVGCPVVVVGGSAGSLEALELFFKNIPRGSFMSFIVITHAQSLPEKPPSGNTS